MRTLVPIVLLAVSLLLRAASGQENAASSAPYPRLVTEATRKDEATLARLTKPGTLLFEDAFESEASFRSYFEVRGQKEGNAAIERERDAIHGGTGSLRLTSRANDGKSTGAGAELWLGDAGHDCVHLRYWIRYAPDYDQGNLNHTGGSICGLVGTNKWTGMGTAGQLPKGDDHFSTRVEGWRDWQRVDAPGFLHSYTYWMDMKRDRDGNYWGNMMGPASDERVVPKRGEWLCVEQRVAVNTLGKDDGELAVWLDGKLYAHHEGFRWRSTAEVKCKRIGLLVYVHEARRDNTVWFDDVAVSTGYIGTGKPRARSDGGK
jgi:hypothetical protein